MKLVEITTTLLPCDEHAPKRPIMCNITLMAELISGATTQITVTEIDIRIATLTLHQLKHLSFPQDITDFKAASQHLYEAITTLIWGF